MIYMLFSPPLEFFLVLSGPVIGIIAIVVIHMIDRPKKEMKKEMGKKE